MSEQDKNELIHSLMRLRKRCCGGVSAACMTTNHRMAKDNAEFQKIIQGVKSLIDERDEARRMWCEAAPVGNSLSVDDMDRRARAEAKRRGWDCYKENTDV